MRERREVDWRICYKIEAQYISSSSQVSQVIRMGAGIKTLAALNHWAWRRHGAWRRYSSKVSGESKRGGI